MSNQYETLLMDVATNGVDKSDRTGTGTRSVFGRQMRFDLNHGFPLVTTKKVHTKSIIAELLWFLKGETNIKSLNEQGVTIWDEWADDLGELGPVYGHQWRSWPGKATLRSTWDGGDISQDPIDQISQVLEALRDNPDSRRHIVSAWNVADLDDMALAPCHLLFQFYVAEDKLSCQLYQRSADMFLGVPFNIASYALLTHMFAAQLGLGVGEFIWTGGDCHIYSNHFEQVDLQLSRKPHPYPVLVMKPRASLFDYELDDFMFVGYTHHPAIKAPVAV